MAEPVLVVFPTEFAADKTARLISNIKRALCISKERFTKIYRDGGIIIIEAADPVMASTTLSSLFGIRQISIANVFENDLNKAADGIADTATRLFLDGEKFLIKVEGESSGYMPKDLELAATSRIIEAGGGKIVPGTEARHERLLYVFLTKKHAYACIFTDAGLGGIPNDYHKKDVLCCIYDELSAIAALAMMREGFTVRLLACHASSAGLRRTARILARMLPRMLRKTVNIDFFEIKAGKKAQNRGLLFRVALRILVDAAKDEDIPDIALGASPLFLSPDIIADITRQVSQESLFVHLPLAGMGNDIMECAKEIGIERPGTIRGTATDAEAAPLARDALRTKRRVSIRPGSNNVHEILDSLGDKQ